MKILVSPTKTMAFDKIPASLQMGMSRPRFEREAGCLNQELKALDLGTVKDLFKTSDKLTQKTWDQIRDFTLAAPGPALFAFQGEAFKTMNPRQFDPDQLAFANKTLFPLAFPQQMQDPSSSGLSKGIQRMVTESSFLIFSSQTLDPHQWE